ncbi:regulator of microtubule dynamics protein 2-like [Sarcoptes scabiei]|nr:regulator of microtubule dynamics protein 2-like [Sarcoptes scabiei]
MLRFDLILLLFVAIIYIQQIESYTVLEKPHWCPKHEHWSQCPTKCPKTCINRHIPAAEFCVRMCDFPHCVCDRHYVRVGYDANGGLGPCVLRSNCHRYIRCRWEFKWLERQYD